MTDSRRYLIAGNWKMNMLRSDGVELAAAVAEGATNPNCDLIVCPPAQLLTEVGTAISHSAVALGGQDCSDKASGAYTGDVSAPMLKDAGCRYVILGHSERRAYHGESDATVKAKAIAALDAGLIPIVCVGETEAERDQGKTMAVISAQLDGSLPDAFDATSLVIAYEPVWAIGTGRTATPEQAQEVHSHIRAHLAIQTAPEVASGMRILYGGSMKPENAGDLLGQSDVDGGLIGGASLKAADFLAIAAAS